MKKSITKNLVVISLILCVLPLFALLLVSTAGALWFYLLVSALPAGLLTGWTVRYIKKQIIEPLRSLTDEAVKISSGDLSHKISYENADEIGMFISAFDDMRSKLFEQQRQQQQFEIERKNFIDSISHDLKTPIASISAHIEALQDGMAATEEEERRYWKMIEDKLGALSKLSDQLSFSYKTAENLEALLQPVNCYQWISDFLDDMKIEAKTHGIVPDLNNLISVHNNAIINIDVHQFDRALQNIISNAFRYAESFFSLTGGIREDTFYLYIGNDGVTLSETKADKIFDRFFTENTNNPHGHLGLGLCISKTILHTMKGELTATIKDNRIQFEIKLPITTNL